MNRYQNIAAGSDAGYRLPSWWAWITKCEGEPWLVYTKHLTDHALNQFDKTPVELLRKGGRTSSRITVAGWLQVIISTLGGTWSPSQSRKCLSPACLWHPQSRVRPGLSLQS